ncbi:insulin receptor substrate 4 [Ambystoma mexicanum]|uniref:insulin receptor substrate 4 n=1 Tax=Ambystoma mexicanum TaxID=8296 RepID=UPI0037E783B5
MASVLNYPEPSLDTVGGECCWPPQQPPEESSYQSLKRSSSASLPQVQEEPQAVAAGGSEDDVRKCGYLRKHKHGHKRFFVLRAASARGPARLEYYDSEKKFRGCGGGLRSPPPKRAIPLYQCFTVSRRADAKHRHLVALYTKDEYFAMAAESEQEQESWYQALNVLMGESKGTAGGEAAAADDEEELLQEADGALKPGAVFKEVWQVHVKPKGLGQSKNLAGVYRLCLSSKMVHLVRLNSDVPCLHLLLMNIRRCGHSENFFFIEVGRSSAVGPGEMWMQVDDSVVAQSMHETFLETMKALKAFADFRPRSKSQSSGSNPISFISSRRTLGNLPPSQTGLQRRSRTESLAGTPPTSKGGSAYRFRTSSEGEGTMTRPFRSVTGSLSHLNTARMNLSRQEGTGRYVRAPFTSSYHTRSASLPVSHFPSTTSPISVCSSSGHGSASDTLTRPSSSSVCGSPSDGGFISSDEYGSSPVDFRYFRVRSGTPDSLGNTPPIREENCLNDYMSMSKQQTDSDSRDDYMEAEKCFRKRTHSLTKPTNVSAQQKTQTSTTLEEVLFEGQPCSDSPTVRESHRSVTISTAKPNYSCNQNGTKSRDDGYMPMMPGVAPTVSSNGDYLPMAPKGGSAPKQTLKSWPSNQVDSKGYMVMVPNTSSPSPVQSPVTGSNLKGGPVTNGEYMDMTCGKQPTASDGSHPSSVSKTLSSYFSLPRSFKALSKHTNDVNEYVPMSSPGKLLHLDGDSGKGSDDRLVNGTHMPVSKNVNEISEQNHRATRPTRLSLETRESNNILRMCHRVCIPEPSSPGEYINIEFTEKASHTPYSVSAEGSPSSLGSSYDHRQSPLSDYMSVDLDVQSPKAVNELSNSLTDISVYPSPSVSRMEQSADYASLPCGSACVRSGNGSDDYTEMTFNLAVTAPVPFAAEHGNGSKAHSPSIVDRLCIVDRFRGSSDFSVPEPCSEATVGPKVIRVDPQGRRRHSSETFSSTTVAASTSLFSESSKRHSSASFDNVWLKPDESHCDLQESESNMSRNSSAGFQNGLNYIALNVHDNSVAGEPTTSTQSCHLQNCTRDLDNGAYVSIDFSRTDGLKCISTRKGD